MKKAFITAVLVASSAAFAPAFAQFQGSTSTGGFTGPGSTAPASSVADVLRSSVDDQIVTLRGNITRHLGGDKYMFSDGTGEIRVDIDRGELPSQPFNEKTTVEIVGEVDREFMNAIEIDVKAMRIVQ